ncbi:MAG: PDZ domain-containing protein, partial [Planctomycetaceae bacterium]|nr:PDZ domain-containing protein [Planctomycetaceae bacterium]
MKHFLLVLSLLASFAVQVRAQADDLATAEEAAVQAAVARVAPSVVRIETVGGLERVGKVLVGEGPTTGLIVAPDGYILSSSFNFAQQPSSILVTLADGTRLPARRVATDFNRMVTLLKVEPSGELPVPAAAPLAEIKVGAWGIAVGRTYEGDQPNVSVGIVSALARIWGKAIQTDAKISPANYGGPLVDIQGRVLGILVPLAPEQAGDVAGVDWYDSGIGFAVPLEQLLAALPRLKGGEDLHPGVLGISLKGKNVYADPAELAIVRPNSPAAKAGLKPGDRIVEVAGQAIARQAQLKSQLNPRYAGDTLHVVALRGTERIECDVQLVEKLLPYDRPFLGILPLRPLLAAPIVAVPPAAGQPPVAAPEQPVTIRFVYPDSPAALAGLQPGDTLVTVAGSVVRGADDLANQVAAGEVGQPLAIQVSRKGTTLEVQPKLARQPSAVPSELPPATTPPESGAAAERPPVGRSAIQLPEYKNECLLYVPQNYDARVPCGLVVWLHGATGLNKDEL